MSKDTTLAQLEAASAIARAQLLAEYPEVGQSWRQAKNDTLASAFDLGFALGARWAANRFRQD